MRGKKSGGDKLSRRRKKKHENREVGVDLRGQNVNRVGAQWMGVGSHYEKTLMGDPREHPGSTE